MGKTRNRINTFKKYRPLLEQLVTKEIKLKYRRSFLGYLWSILNPLMIMMIMVLVFSNMFRFDIQNFPSYLIIGQSIFNYMSESTNQCLWSITGNSALLKKTYVPKYIFPMSRVTSSFVNLLFSLGAMLVVFIVTRVRFTACMLFIPVILVQEYMFCLGLGLFLAQANVFFRDIQYIYSAVLTAWMYLTPLFYPIEMLPSKMRWLVMYFNPLYSYIAQFRTIVLSGVMPSPGLILYGFAVGLLMLAFGTVVFMKNQDKFILYI